MEIPGYLMADRFRKTPSGQPRASILPHALRQIWLPTRTNARFASPQQSAPSPVMERRNDRCRKDKTGPGIFVPRASRSERFLACGMRRVSLADRHGCASHGCGWLAGYPRSGELNSSHCDVFLLACCPGISTGISTGITEHPG